MLTLSLALVQAKPAIPALKLIKTFEMPYGFELSRNGPGSEFSIIEPTMCTDIDAKTLDSHAINLEVHQRCLGTDKNGKRILEPDDFDQKGYKIDLYDIHNGICLQKSWLGCLFSFAQNDPDRISTKDPRFKKPWEMLVPFNVWAWDSYGANPDLVLVGDSLDETRFIQVDYSAPEPKKYKLEAVELLTVNSKTVKQSPLRTVRIGGKTAQFHYVYDLMAFDHASCLIGGFSVKPPTNEWFSSEEIQKYSPGQQTSIDICKINLKTGAIQSKTSVAVNQVGGLDQYMDRLCFSRNGQFVMIKVSRTKANLYEMPKNWGAFPPR